MKIKKMRRKRHGMLMTDELLSYDVKMEQLECLYKHTHNPLFVWQALQLFNFNKFVNLPKWISSYLFETANRMTVIFDLEGDDTKNLGPLIAQSLLINTPGDILKKALAEHGLAPGDDYFKAREKTRGPLDEYRIWMRKIDFYRSVHAMQEEDPHHILSFTAALHEAAEEYEIAHSTAWRWYDEVKELLGQATDDPDVLDKLPLPQL